MFLLSTILGAGMMGAGVALGQRIARPRREMNGSIQVSAAGGDYPGMITQKTQHDGITSMSYIRANVTQADLDAREEAIANMRQDLQREDPQARAKGQCVQKVLNRETGAILNCTYPGNVNEADLDAYQKNIDKMRKDLRKR